MQASHMTPQRIDGGTGLQGRPSHLPAGTRAVLPGPQQASSSLTTSISPPNQAEAGALQLAGAVACCPKVGTVLHVPSAIPHGGLLLVAPALS